jgi:hypothetical protein
MIVLGSKKGSKGQIQRMRVKFSKITIKCRYISPITTAVLQIYKENVNELQYRYSYVNPVLCTMQVI